MSIVSLDFFISKEVLDVSLCKEKEQGDFPLMDSAIPVFSQKALGTLSLLIGKGKEVFVSKELKNPLKTKG